MRSLAHHPEHITSVWSVWRSADKKWVQAPDVKVSADGVAKAVVRPGAESDATQGGQARHEGARENADASKDETLMMAARASTSLPPLAPAQPRSSLPCLSAAVHAAWPGPRARSAPGLSPRAYHPGLIPPG